MYQRYGIAFFRFKKYRFQMNMEKPWVFFHIFNKENREHTAWKGHKIDLLCDLIIESALKRFFFVFYPQYSFDFDLYSKYKENEVLIKAKSKT